MINPVRRIPVFEPDITQVEIDAVVSALQAGEISGTFGDNLPAFETEFAHYSGCEFGVAVNSGSSALLIAVAAAGIGAGDEVLVSASTNIATAFAVMHNGAVPVPVDSEPDTWNLNLDLIDNLVTERTRAIIPVHLYGHPVDMDRLMEIARKHNLIVIEDAAEAHGATVRGRKAGSFGDMACFSFYANKVITTGEGGMVTTNNPDYAEKLRLLRNLGFIQPRFRHEIPAYNFRLPGYVAAMGLAQTRRIEPIIEAKQKMASLYNAALANIPGLQLPVEKEWARNVYWMYGIVINPTEYGHTRDELAAHLKDNGIGTRTFFCPMNQQPVLQKIDGFREIPCPVADHLWEQGLYLPSSHTLPADDIHYVCDVIRDFAG